MRCLVLLGSILLSAFIPAKAQDATDQKLWEPYKPTTWDQIPDGLKSADSS